MVSCCDHCGLEPVDGKLKRCSRCKACFYCSKVCQQGAWKVHRKICCQQQSGSLFLNATSKPIKSPPKTTAAPSPPPCDARAPVDLSMGMKRVTALIFSLNKFVGSEFGIPLSTTRPPNPVDKREIVSFLARKRLLPPAELAKMHEMVSWPSQNAARAKDAPPLNFKYCLYMHYKGDPPSKLVDQLVNFVNVMHGEGQLVGGFAGAVLADRSSGMGMMDPTANPPFIAFDYEALDDHWWGDCASFFIDLHCVYT